MLRSGRREPGQKDFRKNWLFVSYVSNFNFDTFYSPPLIFGGAEYLNSSLITGTAAMIHKPYIENQRLIIHSVASIIPQIFNYTVVLIISSHFRQLCDQHLL